MTVICSRIWAMPSKWTFSVPPLRAIIDRYKKKGDIWIDPFAGQTSPAEVRNDLNPDNPADFHMECWAFLKEMLADGLRPAGVLFDPPYSLAQVHASYKDYGIASKDMENPTGGYPKCKDVISQLLDPGGIVISYGWQTNGMGLKRGFDPIEYLICAHGGNHNDTLVTVERKR